MSNLKLFTCRKCGKSIEAISEAVVWCPCGHMMEKQEPMPKGKQGKVS